MSFLHYIILNETLFTDVFFYFRILRDWTVKPRLDMKNPSTASGCSNCRARAAILAASLLAAATVSCSCLTDQFWRNKNSWAQRRKLFLRLACASITLKSTAAQRLAAESYTMAARVWLMFWMAWIHLRYRRKQTDHLYHRSNAAAVRRSQIHPMTKPM